MTLTPEQLDELIELYAYRCVEDMDTNCLEQFVYDTLVENLSIQSEEDVLEQIGLVYDEETVQEMIESVTVQ